MPRKRAKPPISSLAPHSLLSSSSSPPPHESLPRKVAEAEEWVAMDPCAEDRAEMEGLLAARDLPALERHMRPALFFGTAGLRGRLGAGAARMNVLSVIQASQGVSLTLEDVFGEEAKRRGVVVGFDHRHRSRVFAMATAAVFLHRGFKVWLFPEVAPTPHVAFAIKHLSTVSGIVVTASHNPPTDNGFKVYWDNSAQIVSPIDVDITRRINENRRPWVDYELDAVWGRTADPTEAVRAAYLAAAVRQCARGGVRSSPMQIAYTAMHGVGASGFDSALSAFGLPPAVHVKEQCAPYPDFPTVPFPNPEEAGALSLAMQTGDANNCKVILANDPDADRLGAAEKLADGSWHALTGDEIGLLLAEWVWGTYRARPEEERRGRAPFMLASLVSSSTLSAMALAEGFRFEWMGNKAFELERDGSSEFLFAYEVEIGYMIGNMALDKDGIRCGAVFAQMAHDLAMRRQTLVGHLNELYQRYGWFRNRNGYYIGQPSNIVTAVGALRECREDGEYKYPRSVAGFVVISVKDLTIGFDTSEEGNVPVLPVSADSQFIELRLAEEEKGTCVARLTLRGSGTEPKLKFYAEGIGRSKEAAQERVDRVHAAVSDILRPAANSLVLPS